MSLEDEEEDSSSLLLKQEILGLDMFFKKYFKKMSQRIIISTGVLKVSYRFKSAKIKTKLIRRKKKKKEEFIFFKF